MSLDFEQHSQKNKKRYEDSKASEKQQHQMKLEQEKKMEHEKLQKEVELKKAQQEKELQQQTTQPTPIQQPVSTQQPKSQPLVQQPVSTQQPPIVQQPTSSLPNDSLLAIYEKDVAKITDLQKQFNGLSNNESFKPLKLELDRKFIKPINQISASIEQVQKMVILQYFCYYILFFK